MRANVVIVIDLPVGLDEMIDKINKVLASIEEPSVWRAETQAASQRDGTKSQLILTVGGEVE